MRIERLHLDRYGRFTDRWLDFRGEGVRLHVLHGPNEAGKSTVRSAVTDLLFGIDVRTGYGFRHGYKAMRIGGEIVSSAGERLGFRRRKGDSNTLLTAGATETAIPDGVLRAFLGAMDKDAFERMFALDHQRLRAGGERMLGTNGDLAKSLLDAGTGMAEVGEALKSIESELDELGELGRRSKNKPLWRRLDEYDGARRAVRDQTLRAEDWKQLRANVERAEERRTDIGRQLQALRERSNKLQRVRRVASVLARLTELEAELAGLGAVPDLSPDFAERWATADRTLADATSRMRRSESALEAARKRAEECPPPAAVLGLDEAIAELHRDVGRFRDAEGTISDLSREKVTEEAAIRGMAGELGIGDDVATIAARVPTVGDTERLQTLINSAVKAEAAVEAAGGELDRARAARDAADAALASLPDAPDASAAEAMLAGLPRASDLEARQTAAVREREAAALALREAMGRLDGWSGTADDLAATPFPDLVAVQRHEDAIRSSRDVRDRAEGEVARLGADKTKAETELTALLASGEDIPHRSAVTDARENRDLIWGGLRALHIERTEPSAAQAEAMGDAAAAPDRLEASMRRADGLSDRRETEAARVQQHEAATATIRRLVAELDAAGKAEDAAAERLAQAERAWLDAWASSRLLPGAPADMRTWIARKDEAIRLLAESRTYAEAAEEAAEESDRLRATLMQASEAVGVRPPDGLTLTELHAVVSARVAAAVKAATARREADRKLREESSRVTAAEEALRKANEAAGTRSAALTEAMPGLGLPDGATQAEASAVLSVWNRIRPRVTSLAETNAALAAAQATVEEFRSRVVQVIARLGPDAPDMQVKRQPAEAAATLMGMLAAARNAEASARETRNAVSLAEQEAKEAEVDLERAERACAELRRACGAGDGADVAAMAGRSAEARRLRTDIAIERKRLLSEGDGLTEAQLREELEANPVDGAVATLAGLEAEQTRLSEALEVAAKDAAAAQHALEVSQVGKDAAAAAHDAANVAREAAALAERWAVLSTAKAMLNRAVEMYRAENQDPLVLRGGRIFTGLVGFGPNPIVGLEVSYPQSGSPQLVAVREDESSCGVDGLSEGTRDQLYLSLRLAAVERHVAAAEPMPFLADDLFVTTDEARLEKGLAALAELGDRTQVILFTHHRHVAEAARRLPGALVQSLADPLQAAIADAAD